MYLIRGGQLDNLTNEGIRMSRVICLLMLLTVAPVHAQDYTVIAVSHTDNKVSEVHPITGEILPRVRGARRMVWRDP